MRWRVAKKCHATQAVGDLKRVSHCKLLKQSWDRGNSAQRLSFYFVAEMSWISFASLLASLQYRSSASTWRPWRLEVSHEGRSKRQESGRNFTTADVQRPISNSSHAENSYDSNRSAFASVRPWKTQISSQCHMTLCGQCVAPGTWWSGRKAQNGRSLKCKSCSETQLLKAAENFLRWRKPSRVVVNSKPWKETEWYVFFLQVFLFSPKLGFTVKYHPRNGD